MKDKSIVKSENRGNSLSKISSELSAFTLLCGKKEVAIRENNESHLFSDSYLEERENIWLDCKKTHGDKLWNGKVYAVHDLSSDFENIKLNLQLCEYKDILFKKNKGVNYIANKYGIKNVVKNMFGTVTLITEDGRYMFGIIANGTVQTKGHLDLIGGSLNYDEFRLRSFNDIKEAVATELYEETGIIISPDIMNLFCINVSNFNYEFSFYAKVSAKQISSQFKKSNEIDEVVLLDKEAILSISEKCTDEIIAFRENIQYLESLL